MVSKLYFSFLVCILSFALTTLPACEDNPEECYGDEDCEEGFVCQATYYNSGSRSGGFCVKTETKEDGGESDTSDETDDADDAAVQDSSQASSIIDASTDTAVSGDAATDTIEMDAEATVDGGQSTQPADGANADSEA